MSMMPRLRNSIVGYSMNFKSKTFTWRCVPIGVQKPGSNYNYSQWSTCGIWNAGLCKFRIADSQRGTFLLEDTARIPLNYMRWLLPGFFRFFMPRTTGKKKSHSILAEVIGLDHQEAAGLLLHNGISQVIHVVLDLLVLSSNLMV